MDLRTIRVISRWHVLVGVDPLDTFFLPRPSGCASNLKLKIYQVRKETKTAPSPRARVVVFWRKRSGFNAASTAPYGTAAAAAGTSTADRRRADAP